MKHSAKPAAVRVTGRPLKDLSGSKAVTRESAIPIPRVPWKPTHATLSEIRRAVRAMVRDRLGVDA